MKFVRITALLMCISLISWIQVYAQNDAKSDSIYSFLQEIPDEVFEELLSEKRVGKTNSYKQTEESLTEYVVQPGTKDNRIELRVTNTNDKKISDLIVYVEGAPEWITIKSEGREVSTIDAGEAINFQFSFDINSEVTVQKKAQIVLVAAGENYNYRKIVNIVSGVPNTFQLFDNYPNPFNPSTNIRYNLPEKGTVKIEIFNILGQKVTVLVDELQTAGSYTKTWDASNVASGMYLYRMTVFGESGKKFFQNKKMLLIK